MEDDPQIRLAVAAALEQNGHQARLAADGATALTHLIQDPPDLVLLDLGLPDMDGSTLLTMVRSISNTAVIVVTARTEPEEIIRLLNLGADDYVIKPFDLDQLLARINAVLRRSGRSQQLALPETIRIGALVLGVHDRSLTLAENPIELRHLEFELLLSLALADGQLVPTEALIRHLWGDEVDLADGAGRLDVHLSQLRSKLGESARRPRYLHRVRHLGIRLAPPLGSDR